jgi:hypothetical protein
MCKGKNKLPQYRKRERRKTINSKTKYLLYLLTFQFIFFLIVFTGNWKLQLDEKEQVWEKKLFQIYRYQNNQNKIQ